MKSQTSATETRKHGEQPNKVRAEILKALRSFGGRLSVYELSRKLCGRASVEDINAELSAMDLDGEVRVDSEPIVKIVHKVRKARGIHRKGREGTQREANA